MADYHQIAAAAAQKYGVPVNVFLRQIQQESGFNPAARSGAGAEGIAQFMPATARQYGVNTADPVSSLNGAARMMGDLIRQYGSVPRALSAYNSGKPDAYKDPGFAQGQTFNYVKSILGGSTSASVSAAPPPRAAPTLPAVAGPRPAAAGVPAPRGLSAGLLAAVNTGNQMFGLAPLPQSLLTPPTPVAAPTLTAPQRTPLPGAPVPAAVTLPPGLRAGSPVASLTSTSGEHETMGLAGYPAKDYFAPAGSAAVAPVTGKVVRLSGHDPRLGPVQGPHGPLGWSVYIQGTDGREYYLTHMGSRSVQVGQTVKAGQPIGTVANYAKYGTPSHIHMGVSG